jgi:hypothetical protein
MFESRQISQRPVADFRHTDIVTPSNRAAFAPLVAVSSIASCTRVRAQSPLTTTSRTSRLESNRCGLPGGPSQKFRLSERRPAQNDKKRVIIQYCGQGLHIALLRSRQPVRDGFTNRLFIVHRCSPLFCSLGSSACFTQLIETSKRFSGGITSRLHNSIIENKKRTCA